MKLSARWFIRGSIALSVFAVALILIARTWLIPSILKSTLTSRLHGTAYFSSWWVGGSAGIKGLTLAEAESFGAPIWLTAERVETNLSLFGLLRGRVVPTKVIIDHPKIHLTLNAKGDLLTQGPFINSGEPVETVLPAIEVNGAEVTIAQEGRPSFVLTGLTGLLGRNSKGELLQFVSDDPTWGKWTLNGEFTSDFKAGELKLASGPGFRASPDRTARVPFVPLEVWENITADGPVDLKLSLKFNNKPTPSFNIQTSIDLHGTAATLPSLGLTSRESRGHVEVDDGRVNITGFSGRTLSGTIKANGTLDFKTPSPRLDLLLELDKIDVAQAPKSWQFDELDATGLLTGSAHLLISLTPNGPDLTGSSGIARIEDGKRQGIPIKSLDVVMHAAGEDIQFEPQGAEIASTKTSEPESGASVFPGLKLPGAITTRIELEDVNLTQLLGQLERFTFIKMPVPVTGHLALKAQATIPLGRLANLRGYIIRGEATLTAASIDGVSLGRISSRFDLSQGVLMLENVQGQLVERSAADATGPPPATPALPLNAPLVPGSFRGKLRGELSPTGKLVAHFDGNELPIGEILAPYRPKPSHVTGRLTTSFDASADVASLGNARGWSAKGKLSSNAIGYLGATLDSIDTDFTIVEGHVTLPDLSARLGGHPLKASGSIDMDATREFSATVDISQWSAERLLALIPDLSPRLPIQGLIDAHLRVSGTFFPRMVRADGNVVVHKMMFNSVPLGDVSTSWKTEGKEIVFRPIDAKPFGGVIKGFAVVPISPGPPIRVEAEIDKIDTSNLAALLGEGHFSLDGVASGKLAATIPGDGDLKSFVASITLSSPALKVQGVPAGVVTASIRGKDGMLVYEASADGPDGRARFNGTFPLDGPLADRTANAELRAAGFTLTDVWNLVGMKGTPTQLLGRAAIDANLRARPDADLALGIHGVVEVRDLRWGQGFPLGNLRGVLAKTPDAFRLDSLRGELFGGAFSGIVWGETPAKGPVGLNFELQTDRASLPRLFAFAPNLVKQLEGIGSVRLTGRMDETLRASAEISIPQAKFHGIPISELRIPAELTIHPAAGTGLLIARRWTSRVSGGRVQGAAMMKVGQERSFNVDLNLTDLDIETFSRAESNAARPGSGKLNGRINLNGPDPSSPQRMRGKVELNLNDASLGDIPVIRELDRFLGGARGGAFEEGTMLATIGNRQLSIDQLTLQGRLIQIHATGSVTFEGGLDLAVLVNTNQLIPQTGQTLVSLIPGLRSVIGRNEEAILRVSNYLSNRLLKFRISGTIKNPSVAIDSGVAVGDAATSFFAGALKLPLGFVK